MEQRIYHGTLTPNQIAQALVAKFNRSNLRAQQVGTGKQVVVQVATRPGASSGGQTAISITLQKVEDGLAVQVGKQAWLGVAASLGQTAMAAIRNPFNLLGRLDDLAQDIENLQVSQQVWETVEEVARAAGASFELSERLRRMVCAYCSTANPVGEPSCIACGAPLGSAQPRTCTNCGFVVKANESNCPNCRQPIRP
ncbi:MAG TPA: zinc ribbon domain-containing protein [Anaerolineales bacterium]|nr:zinc ribbon domain-containing protein [Anaerolineales bacterium]